MKVTPADILQHFHQRHQEWKKKEPLIDGLDNHLFFITVKFDLQQIPGWRSDLTKVIGEFGRLYFKTSRQMIGNHLGKKRNLQPLTYAYTDFESTRSGKRTTDIIKSGFPHVHALALARPEHLFRFPLMLQSQGLLLPTIKDCDIQPFDQTKSRITDIISYCMKGFDQVPDWYSGKQDLWGLYPR